MHCLTVNTILLELYPTKHAADATTIAQIMGRDKATVADLAFCTSVIMQGLEKQAAENTNDQCTASVDDLA